MEFYSPPLTRARARILNKPPPSTPLLEQSPKPKSRVFDDLSADLICDLPSKSDTIDHSTSCELKKVKLTQDELSMSGAPTGDIFDIKVLCDNELTCLPQPESQVGAALQVLSTQSSTWADRYAAIEVLRRSTLFSPAVLSDTSIRNTVHALSQELDSLRSCTIRNSVLCLQSLLKLPLCLKWIESSENAHVYDEVIGKLLLKSCSGPKFLCKIILEVFVLGAKVLPFSRLAVLLTSFSTHKNSEVCSHVFTCGCENFLDNMNTMIEDSNGKTMETTLRLFQRGISSVQPTGRGMARKALKEYANRIGIEAFAKVVSQYFSMDQCNEINREINRITVNKGISRTRVPLRALNSANRAVNAGGSLGEMRGGAVAAKGRTDGVKPWEIKKRALNFVKVGSSDTVTDSTTSTSFIL